MLVRVVVQGLPVVASLFGRLHRLFFETSSQMKTRSRVHQHADAGDEVLCGTITAWLHHELRNEDAVRSR